MRRISAVQLGFINGCDARHNKSYSLLVVDDECEIVVMKSKKEEQRDADMYSNVNMEEGSSVISHSPLSSASPATKLLRVKLLTAPNQLDII